MRKIDLKKEWKTLYAASARKPALVDVPRLKYLMIDGEGNPQSNPVFQESIQALFSVAYTMKMTLKMGPEKIDYPVMGMEGLWWAVSGCMDKAAPKDWRWTLLIPLPEFITAATVRTMKKTVKEKKGLAAVDRVRLEAWREGKVVQMLHVGPYAEEPATIAKMIEFAAESGYQTAGKHHEIYLSDPGRTKPERLKTILRLQVKK